MSNLAENQPQPSPVVATWEQTSGTDSLSGLFGHHVEQMESLISKSDLHDAIIEHFPGGLCAFDKDMNMVACNEQLKKLLDYPAELFGDGLPTVEKLFRYKAERGEYGPGDIERHVESRLRLVAQGQPHRYQRQRADGTTLEVRGRPLTGGGFLITYQEATVHKNHTGKLPALIESFPGGIAVFDQHYNMILCNEALQQRISGSNALFANGFPTLENYVWHNAKNGEYGAGMVSSVATKRLAYLKAGKLLKHDVLIDNQQAVEVIARPLRDGGFVETHLNVTQERLRSQQLETVLENFPGGVSMYDKSLNLVLYNHKFQQLMDYPDALFADGMPSLERLFYQNAADGEFGEGDVTQLVADRLELARERQPHSFNRTKSDGTVVEIQGIPVSGGGFLATHYDVTERIQQQADAIKMANYSPVTGLPNRALFQDRMNLALAQAERGVKMAMLHVDLHNFKGINDVAGQRTGDKLLRVLGDRFMENKRDTDTFAHLGGDEFAVIQVGIEEIGGAEVLARRILRTVREPIEMDGAIYELEACIGIALAPENGTFFDEIQTKASTALSGAKDVGPGMIMFFHSCVNRTYLS